MYLRQTPEQPENSEDIESEQSVPACFPQKESTSLGDVEYNAVVSSVADIVTTESSTASSSRKRGKYTHFSAEIRAKIGKYATLKPLHASWLVDLYNHLSSDIGRRHIAKGWEKAGIAQLLDESFSLPPEDPFEEIEGSIEIS
ncbi:hypothetical protein OS493_018521 [Desmophyllum pertusum]|uniref:Uncharacterized protein n=1 Tax=Desmophyllum pertusum TaxID=174260 RepID=A0A9X0A277_9CNID|nr:hypothetical protein OS493_018521 [Desmophyllum pertusum]